MSFFSEDIVGLPAAVWLVLIVVLIGLDFFIAWLCVKAWFKKKENTTELEASEAGDRSPKHDIQRGYEAADGAPRGMSPFPTASAVGPACPVQSVYITNTHDRDRGTCTVVGTEKRSPSPPCHRPPGEQPHHEKAPPPSPPQDEPRVKSPPRSPRFEKAAPRPRSPRHAKAPPPPLPPPLPDATEPVASTMAPPTVYSSVVHVERSILQDSAPLAAPSAPPPPPIVVARGGEGNGEGTGDYFHPQDGGGRRKYRHILAPDQPAELSSQLSVTALSPMAVVVGSAPVSPVWNRTGPASSLPVPPGGASAIDVTSILEGEGTPPPPQRHLDSVMDNTGPPQSPCPGQTPDPRWWLTPDRAASARQSVSPRFVEIPASPLGGRTTPPPPANGRGDRHFSPPVRDPSPLNPLTGFNDVSQKPSSRIKGQPEKLRQGSFEKAPPFANLHASHQPAARGDTSQHKAPPRDLSQLHRQVLYPPPPQHQEEVSVSRSGMRHVDPHQRPGSSSVARVSAGTPSSQGEFRGGNAAGTFHITPSASSFSRRL
eukprot:Hpha_TRINITY_DN35334_c0_g1::TRINITY_DN35334_c0_g1_i1::g.85030::m.85030